MKAVIQSSYGPPEEVLSVQDVAKPVPKDDEVLVRNRAASMHPDVWHALVGFPFVLRLMGNGLFTPTPIPGTDIAGVVESAGKNVTRFKAGDEVSSYKIFEVKGDRADINVKQSWKDGVHTSLVSRKLVTGSKLDVQFSDLSAQYPFGFAAFDNAQVRHAVHYDALFLRFAK